MLMFYKAVQLNSTQEKLHCFSKSTSSPVSDFSFTQAINFTKRNYLRTEESDLFANHNRFKTG